MIIQIAWKNRVGRVDGGDACVRELIHDHVLALREHAEEFSHLQLLFAESALVAVPSIPSRRIVPKALDHIVRYRAGSASGYGAGNVEANALVTRVAKLEGTLRAVRRQLRVLESSLGRNK
jgi:hypothetical protein